MKPFWILVICIFAYSDYPTDDGFVDYAADFDSTATVAQQDPPNYFTDESAGRTVASDDSAADDPAKDPGLKGGTTEPAADEVEPKKVAKTEAEEEADYYKECRDKGYAAEQCCKTCVESYLTNWAEETCYDEDDCEKRQIESAESAVREGSSNRAPASSQSEGVSSGN